IAIAPPNSDISIVILRPSRSASVPPTSDAAIDPAPNTATIPPASLTLTPRTRIKYIVSSGTTNPPSRLTSVPHHTYQYARGATAATAAIGGETHRSPRPAQEGESIGG